VLRIIIRTEGNKLERISVSSTCRLVDSLESPTTRALYVESIVKTLAILGAELVELQHCSVMSLEAQHG
jgi:hypothetical protein